MTIDEAHNTLTLDQIDFIEKSWAKWQARVEPSRPGGARGVPWPNYPSRVDLEMLTSAPALEANKPTPAQSADYKSCVGDLGWVCNRTRFDCLSTYNMLAQALDKSNDELMQRALELHAHLYHTRHAGRISYSRSTYNDPVFFSDANLGAFRSTTGYVGYLANGPVMAASRRQRCTCLSSSEAELVALSAATCDVIWLRIFLDELGFRPLGPTPVHCDNTGARAVAENPIAARHLKHVARRHFFVQDAVRAGEVTVPFVASDANLADLLTKSVCTPRFSQLAARLRAWTMAC